LLLQETGKNKEAIDILHELRDNYPTATRTADAEKYLAKWGDVGDISTKGGETK
jgi:hypothetical protein